MLPRSLLLLIMALPLAIAAQPKKTTKPAAASNWKTLLQNTWVMDSVVTEEYSRSGKKKVKRQDMDDEIVTITITKDQIINPEFKKMDKESVEYKAIQDGNDRYVIAMGLAVKVLDISKNRLVVRSEIPLFGRGGEITAYFSPLSEQVKNMEKRLPGTWSNYTPETSSRYNRSGYNNYDEGSYRNILALELKPDHSMKMLTTTGRDSGKWELQSGELKLNLDGGTQDYLLYVHSISDDHLTLGAESKSKYGKKLKLKHSQHSIAELRSMIEKDSVVARTRQETERRRRDSIQMVREQRMEIADAPIVADMPAPDPQTYSSLVAGKWIAVRYVDLGGAGNQQLGKEARLDLYTNDTYELSFGKKKIRGKWRRSLSGDFLLMEIDKKEVVAPFYLVKAWSSERKKYEVQELQLTITLPGDKQAKKVLFKSLN